MLLAITVSTSGCDVLFTQDPTPPAPTGEPSGADSSQETEVPEKKLTEEPVEDTRSQAEVEVTISTLGDPVTQTEDASQSSDESAMETTAIYIEIETPETVEDSSVDPSSTEDPFETGASARPTVSDPSGLISDIYPAGLFRTVTDPFVPLTQAKYDAATQYNESSNNYRLAQVIKKAQAGKPVTIGVIGGSITQGTGTYWEGSSYAQILEGFWRGRFPQSNLTFINAGIGGTDSYLGVHRVSSLLAANPDFVIIEFSVNDAADSAYQTYYENLVRRVKAAPSAPAVLLLFMTTNTGADASSYEIPIGRKYAVPMISYRESILAGIRENEYKWTDIAVDFIHPNVHGHSLAARLIIHYLLTTIDAVNAGNYQTSDVPVPNFATAYANAELYDSRVLKPVNMIGFSEGTPDSESFKFGWTTSQITEVSKTDSAVETPAASYGTPATKVKVLFDGADDYFRMMKRSKDVVIYSDKDTVAKSADTSKTQPATTAAQKNTEASTEAATAAPTTAAPTKPAPTTAAPTTAAPTKPAPTTAAPTTAAPTTAAPTKPAPTTAAPTTAVPTKPEPTTTAPTTVAPSKPEPTMAAPTTPEPTTEAPATEPVVPGPVQGNHEITFTVNAKNIGFLFHVYRDGTGQIMQVYIDGQFVGTLNGSGIDEINSYDKSVEFYTSRSSREHTITIKLDPASGGSRFALEALLLS